MQKWTDEQIDTLRILRRNGRSTAEISHAVNKTYRATEAKLFRLAKDEGLAPQISRPVTRIWDNPLHLDGNALIFPDIETPYHNADFINRCIELATRWNITRCILAGDFVHFANYSQWGADFAPSKVTEITDPAILAIIDKLPKSEQAEARQTLLDRLPDSPGDADVSSELSTVRQTAREIDSAFESVIYIMGNHEQRKLRMMELAEDVGELARLIGAGDNWQASPYYYCLLETAGGTYRITHPRGAGIKTAIDLAIQYHQHIIMGHSHRWAVQRDPSGDYWAIQAGHCVDETRLQYVMQRDAKRDAHALGAVIIRDGFPFVLCDSFPFQIMVK